MKEERLSVLEAGSLSAATSLYCSPFSWYLRRGRWSLPRVLQHWGKGDNQIFEATGHWLWTDTDSRRPQTSLRSASQVGVYRGRAINVLAQDYFPWTQWSPKPTPVLISSLKDYVIGTNILSNWQNPTLVARSNRCNLKDHKSG